MQRTPDALHRPPREFQTLARWRIMAGEDIQLFADQNLMFVPSGVVHAYVGQKVLKRYIILIFSNFTVSQN